MFCTNCGQTLTDTARFCTNCGAAVNQPPLPEAQSVSEEAEAMTAREYFSSACSQEAAKRGKTLNWMFAISCAVQIVFCILRLFTIILPVALFMNATDGPSDFLISYIPVLLATFALPVVLSPVFARKGIRRRSIVMLVISAVFAFLSIILNRCIDSRGVWDWTLTIALCLLHIVMVVLASKDRKEYKEYLAGIRCLNGTGVL